MKNRDHCDQAEGNTESVPQNQEHLAIIFPQHERKEYLLKNYWLENYLIVVLEGYA